jgi:hypothetical protein
MQNRAFLDSIECSQSPRSTSPIILIRQRSATPSRPRMRRTLLPLSRAMYRHSISRESGPTAGHCHCGRGACTRITCWLQGQRLAETRPDMRSHHLTTLAHMGMSANWVWCHYDCRRQGAPEVRIGIPVPPSPIRSSPILPSPVSFHSLRNKTAFPTFRMTLYIDYSNIWSQVSNHQH